MLESQRSRSVGVFGRAYIDELEAKADDHCRVWWESPCSLVERWRLLGRHCCLEKDSFCGMRRELVHHRHQRRRCDLKLEAY